MRAIRGGHATSSPRASGRLRADADRVPGDRRSRIQGRAAGGEQDAELGALVDDGVDIMELHTKEGFRMFMGRRRDPEGRLSAIPGGKRIASSLKALWLLSANDNPYADWALLRADERLTHLQRTSNARPSSIARRSSGCRPRAALRGAALARTQTGGARLQEPYGYAIAELIAEFDLFARVVKTLVRKNRFRTFRVATWSAATPERSVQHSRRSHASSATSPSPICCPAARGFLAWR